jgi:serine/threonine protein kinase
MIDGLPLRLKLAIGRVAVMGEERPATGGVRCFEARLPGDSGGGPPTHQVVLGALPPDGPEPASVAALVEAMRALNHPHLVEVTAVGEFEGRAWVVEELVHAPTIAERISRRGVLSVREAVAVLREIARALVSLHRLGAVHGSIHPAMIWLLASGSVRVRTGPGEGTPQGDLRALGSLGSVMLTGARPGGTGVLGRPRIPSELRDLLEQLVQPDPDRPLRAEEVLTVLDSFPATHDSPLDALFEGAGRGSRNVERHPALLIVVLAALGILFYFLRNPTR